MEIPSIIDILSVPTETKPNKANIDLDNVNNIIDRETIEAPQPKASDFAPVEPPIKESIAKEPIIENKNSHSENIQTAGTLIGLYDILQTFILPLGYKASMFDKNEYKQIQNIKIRMRQDTTTVLSEQEQVLLEKFSIFQELRDNIPFGESEIDTIIKPLAKVLGKYNVELGAEFMLISALGIVALPRLMPMFSKLENNI